MAQIILWLTIMFFVCLISFTVWDKFFHPLIFKEELKDTLERAVEKRTKNNVEEKAEDIEKGG